MTKSSTPVCLFFLVFIFFTSLTGQEIQTFPAQISQARLLGKTAPLSKLMNQNNIWHPGSKKKYKAEHPGVVPNFEGNSQMPNPFRETALPQDGDPLRAIDMEKDLFPVLPDQNFEGMNESVSNVLPPDPVGDVSPFHYIQMVNATPGSFFQIYDKEGNAIGPPTSPNVFWQPFNVTGFGDPIILFDHDADRWLITEFGGFGTNVMLLALSETSDPLGNWFAYEVQSPEFPDYPKFGIWNNGYFITTNEPTDENIPVYAVDREAMLAGAPTAAVQRLGVPKFGATTGAFQVLTPFTWEGNNPPPPGSPFYVVRIYDDAWEGGQDKLEIWEVHIDWDIPANSFTSGPIDIPLAPFDSELCDNNIFTCIDQGEGTLVSALQHVIMYRVNYRNFGTHESVVLNFSVDVNGNNQAGIRWVELQKNQGEEWALRQEGTYAPDEHSRFMGSVNMDGSGNLLLAYSVTGGNELKPLSLRFTGRLANDPLGEMTIDEYEFATGEGINFNARWGDYASMSVDPGDQVTFWFTGEFMQGSQWGTKIMSALLRRDSNDVGIQGIIQPQNSGYLTDNETVTVAVRNYGYYDQDSIGISMIFNGQPVVNEIVTDTIPADSTYLHTFAPTVDMSAIGDYPFIFYTTLASDTAFFNDTLRTVVSQLERNDAAVTGFENIAFPFCDSIADIGIIFSNLGVDTLTSVTVVYQINDEMPISIPWTGILPPSESETIPIIADMVVEGSNSITASTNMPNEVADEAPGNDTLSRTFLIVNEGSTIRLELLTDDYPQETSWEIRDEQGMLLYFGGPYEQPQTLFVEEFCLPEGCYEFTIFDSYGDGIQFGNVVGDYRILNEEGIIIASLQEANFGTSETSEFCSDFECSILANFLKRNESAPGAEDGRILLQANNGTPPYQYSIDGGENFQSSSLFSNLPGGTYEVVIRDASNCEANLIIIVYTCVLSAETEIVDASSLGSADGTVTVSIQGGIPPYVYGLDGETGDLQSDSLFTNLMAGVYQLFVEDSVGCEIEMEIIVGPTTSIEKTEFTAEVELIPNPTNGYLQINVRGLQGLSVLPLRLIDAAGRIVKHDRLVAYDGVLTNRISLHNLPNGIYYIHFLNEQVEQLVKVVKQE